MAGAGGAVGVPGNVASGGTNWLAPLTQQQIVSQATKAVKAAYAPSFKELQNQSSRAQAISDKRTSDNKYYTSWLQSQMGALQAHNDAALSNIQQWEQGIVGQQQAVYGGQQQALENSANARAGNVSNNAQSASFGSQLQGNQQGTMGQLTGSEMAGAQMQGLEHTMLNSAEANNFNFVNAAQQKQLSDLNTVLDKINTARQTLSGKQANDITAEISRMQATELQKAQSNRNFAAAAEKLGLQKAMDQNLADYRAAQVKQAGLNYNLNLTKAQQAQMNADRTYKLDVAKFGQQVAKDKYLRDNNLGPYRPNKNPNAWQPLGQASQNAIFNKINTIRGQIQSLIINQGMSPEQAWHALHNGTYILVPQVNPDGTVDKTKPPTKKWIAPVGDDGLLNAAYNTRSSGGTGLTSGDVNYLHSLGVVVGNRLPTQSNEIRQYQGPH